LIREDIGSLAILFCFALAAVLVGLFVAMTGHWLSGVMYRLGATEYPASWIAYGLSAVAWIIIGLSVGGRVVNGSWWWRDQ